MQTAGTSTINNLNLWSVTRNKVEGYKSSEEAALRFTSGCTPFARLLLLLLKYFVDRLQRFSKE